MKSIIVPWKNQNEWNQVYSDIFSEQIEKQQKALDQIAGWRFRGKIPHAVDITSLLILTLLKYKNKKYSTELELRLELSTSIIRFVNGLVDSKQKKQHVIPVSNIAKDINLPQFFVEIRHDSTHNNLPSLEVLQNAAYLCLDWLKNRYWDVYQNIVDSLQENIISNLSEMQSKILTFISKQKKEKPLENQKKIFNISGNYFKIIQSFKNDDFDLCSSIVSLFINSEIISVEIMSNYSFSQIVNSWIPFILRLFLDYNHAITQLIMLVVNKLIPFQKVDHPQFKMKKFEIFSEIISKSIDICFDNQLFNKILSIFNFPKENQFCKYLEQSLSGFLEEFLLKIRRYNLNFEKILGSLVRSGILSQEFHDQIKFYWNFQQNSFPNTSFDLISQRESLRQDDLGLEELEKLVSNSNQNQNQNQNQIKNIWSLSTDFPIGLPIGLSPDGYFPNLYLNLDSQLIHPKNKK
ncbi:hypothetical protein M0811_00720 [Anaeramoeba ignava]|uniref:Las1-like protein n=1 Tax=Anaeramoeba ignava TaxID=1746090 RepID=A0A9Q0LJQ6_ANAIG|nr:hypothetical protein M0811_00720 [Anaeramoeba ignava]